MVGTMLWIDWTSREHPEDRAKFLMEMSAANSGPRKCDTTEMADWASWFYSGMDEPSERDVVKS